MDFREILYTHACTCTCNSLDLQGFILEVFIVHLDKIKTTCKLVHKCFIVFATVFHFRGTITIVVYVFHDMSNNFVLLSFMTQRERERTIFYIL